MSEITVGIPTFNAMKYLPYILEKLQHQKIPNLPVIIQDQGSVDGIHGYLSNISVTNWFSKKSQELNSLIIGFVAGRQDPKLHPYVNAMRARKSIAKSVKTEFVFFLDPDVALAPFTLKNMLEASLIINI